MLHALNNGQLSALASDGVTIPDYRLAQGQPEVKIVHLGPGAFFRAHQAWYTHQAMKQSGEQWGICAVSMRSSGVYDALHGQDGLYCLAELDRETSFEVVGSISEVLIASRHYELVMARLVVPSTEYVTMTITEKGYCLDSSGLLDLNHPDILQDLNGDKDCISAVGMLVTALGERMRRHGKTLSIISCDNLTDNGHKLKAALISFASQKDKALAGWIEQNVVCPCTMVDSITPATDDALRTTISEKLNVSDNWPIKRESFVQWVIEDVLPDSRPAWELAGAVFTKDVRGFEHAKLRLLNCPHSSLAYIGTLLGIENVYDAMQNETLVAFVNQMIDAEIHPSIDPPKEMDATQYSQDIMNRFRNPAICHLLSQIAWDGSQKLPMRILPIIEQNVAEGRSIASLSVAVASWFVFLRKRFKDNEELVDPLAQELLAKAARCNGDAAHDVRLFLDVSDVFTREFAGNDTIETNLIAAYEQMQPLLENSQHSWSVTG